MNAFFKASEINSGDCPLRELVKTIDMERVDVQKLDAPIVKELADQKEYMSGNGLEPVPRAEDSVVTLPDKKLERVSENQDSESVKEGGGSYKDVKSFVNDNGHENKEVHHMPSDYSSPLERAEGPCIEMDKEDHRKTASCGRSVEAQEYREKQRELIDQGDFRGALQMDIDDIHEKFGNKYDAPIQEMLKYVDKLEQEGKI